MTYFELFDIPVQLKVNAASLSKQFFSLSRRYHPDYAATGSPAEQAEALEKSALLNKAWSTFQSTDSTTKYTLQLKGLLEEEEKYTLPPAFLMEVMEINEELMDADDAAARESLKPKIENLQSEIYAPVKDIIENYQENTHSEKELLQVKEYYYKKKYLDRMMKV